MFILRTSNPKPLDFIFSKFILKMSLLVRNNNSPYPRLYLEPLRFKSQRVKDVKVSLEQQVSKNAFSSRRLRQVSSSSNRLSSSYLPVGLARNLARKS